MTPAPWLVAALLLVLAEVVSFNFVFASFAIGAVASAVASALRFGAVGEAAVFAAASVASLALIRPAVLAHLYRRSDAGPTGVAKLIGRTAVAVDAVTAESGSVIIDGDTWSARTEQGTIAAGQPARITAITGAIARVTPA